MFQAHAANEPLVTSVACSHSSTAADDTTAVPELGPNVHGVQQLQIMTQINSLVTAQAEEE